MNQNKPFMKYVVRTTTQLIGEGAYYLLECGHEEWRSGKRKPTRLLCKRCQWKAEQEASEPQGAGQ